MLRDENQRGDERADTTAAEDHFRRSLDLARRQGVLAWELQRFQISGVPWGRMFAFHRQTAMTGLHEEVRFAADSLVEEAGLEPSVPA